MKVHRLNFAFSNTRPCPFLCMFLNKILGAKLLNESTRQIIVDCSQSCYFTVAVQSKFFTFEDAYRNRDC